MGETTNQTKIMKAITRIDAITFVNELHNDYKEQFENYDDDYSLEIALGVLRSGEEFCAEDVKDFNNPYLDALWEELQ